LEFVGLTKQLNHCEKLVYASSPTEIFFLKQEMRMRFRSWQKNEKIESMIRGIIFLTDQRLIFLKLFEVPGVSSGQRKNILAGSSGTFLDVPLKDISHMAKRQITLSKENAFRFVTVFGGDEHAVDDGPALEIVYNQKAVEIKKGKVPLADSVLILGDPMFALQPALREQFRVNVIVQQQQQ
jgi:hypothetical protein